MNTRFEFSASCGDCGGALEHDQSPVFTPAEQTALTHCADCDRQWLINVRLIRVANPASERRARHRAAARERELVPA